MENREDRERLLNDIIAHKDKLRDADILASLDQRIFIAKQRIEDKDWGELIQVISAVEAFVRAWVLHLDGRSEDQILETYATLRKRKNQWQDTPGRLIKKYLQEAFNKSPEDVFTEETWKAFKVAVDYSNLLVHECTGLRAGYLYFLIEVGQEVFEKLIEVSGQRLE